LPGRSECPARSPSVLDRHSASHSTRRAVSQPATAQPAPANYAGAEALARSASRKIIDQTEARSILEDAAAAHRNSIPLVTDGGTVAHEEAASLIETMLKGGNSVRHA
jgi:hypothetical protein